MASKKSCPLHETLDSPCPLYCPSQTETEIDLSTDLGQIQYCGRRLTLEGFNSAECLDAGILHLWHPTKNGDLKPSQVSDRTAKRIGCNARRAVRMAREPAGDSQRESQVPVVPWEKGTLSRQGQQRPRAKEAGRRQAAPPRAERRPARRRPSRPRRRHGVVVRTVRPRLAREGAHALHARRRQLPVLQEPQAAARLQRPGYYASRARG